MATARACGSPPRWAMSIAAMAALACEGTVAAPGDPADARAPLAEDASTVVIDAAPPAPPDAACVDTCGVRECGDDGCGGTCGLCEPLAACTDEAWCVAPATGPLAPPIRVATYNACGNNCAYTGITPAAWTEDIAGTIEDWNADAVLFTELCYGQLSRLRTRLGTGWGYAWLASHTALTGCARWGADTRFGMAILAKHTEATLPGRRTEDLQPVGSCGDSNQRSLLCTSPAIDGVTTLLCVTHLTHRAGDCRATQSARVAALTLEWSGGGATILGGDLNARPDSDVLDVLYALSGGGRYLESDQEDPAWWPDGCTGACRSGELTFPAATPDRKIDYVMFSADHFRTAAGDVVPSDGSMSDHRMTRGAAERK